MFNESVPKLRVGVACSTSRQSRLEVAQPGASSAGLWSDAAAGGEPKPRVGVAGVKCCSSRKSRFRGGLAWSKFCWPLVGCS